MPSIVRGSFRQATHRYRAHARGRAEALVVHQLEEGHEIRVLRAAGPSGAAAQIERGSGVGAAAEAGVPEDQVIIRERER